MDEADSDAKCVKEAGCDHETDTIKHTTGTQRQFRAVGMSVGNGKDAHNNCRRSIASDVPRGTPRTLAPEPTARCTIQCLGA